MKYFFNLFRYNIPRMQDLDYNNYPFITLNDRQVCDYELLANGGFSPLDGFMTKSDYESCVENMRLKNGELWTMPIVLHVSNTIVNNIKDSPYVVLKHKTGLPLAIVDIQDKKESVYQPNIQNECAKVYRTNDDNHPYVKILKTYEQEGLTWCIGGKLVWKVLPPQYDFSKYRLTPKQTKDMIAKNNWKKVIGFQTRNPMHRSHYELTKYALRKAGEDSHVLIQPVVGVTQECDVNYHTRVKCYLKLLQNYEPDTAQLCLLPLSMRMAGPREAVWHSQIRKNYGCTHFVVGRDHAGPSFKTKEGESFYGPYDAQDLLYKHANEIGIIPITSKMIVYATPKNNKGDGVYMPIDEIDETKYQANHISGTQQRKLLTNGDEIPDWFSFPEVVGELRKEYLSKVQQGLCLYFVGLSGCGKTTIANFIISRLRELTHRKITYLDGDIVRTHISKGLGFTKEDRSTNVRRIGYICSEVTKHNGIAVAANIAPYDLDREVNRKMISAHGNYVEIFIDTPLEVCESRDVKGLYKLAREGKIKEFTGISDPFEKPKNPDILIDGTDNLDKSINKIICYLQEHSYLE